MTTVLSRNWKFLTNRNGDSPQGLMEEFLAVKLAADALAEKVAALTVHGRNFQTYPTTGEDKRSYENDLALKQEMFNAARSVSKLAEAGVNRAYQQKVGR